MKSRIRQRLQNGGDRRAARAFRLALERLDDRCLPSANVLQTNLVSDLSGVAMIQDPHLVNPWGIASSGGSPFWISDNNAGVSTLYNYDPAHTPPIPLSINPLVVSIPGPGNAPDVALGADGTPTGTVFNLDGGTTGGFVLNGFKADGKTATSASAVFLFVTEDGTIVGWNSGVNPAGVDAASVGTHGIIAVDNSANPNATNGAVYKGLATARSTTPIFSGDPNSTAVLYVSNFRAGQVEVYDTNFTPVKLPAGAFTDSDIPKDYAPFNVQVLGDKVYVTYAKQDKAKHDDDAGPHRGFVDVFNLNGTPGLPGMSERLVSRGPLDSPWGLAIAPASFGSLAGALLVGNFGDGHINAFNATTGAFLGELQDPDGEPITIDGLWALRVGNGGNGGDPNQVYFTAGLFGETHGLFGSLTSVAAGTPEGPAEAQMVQAALDVVQLDLSAVRKDISSGAPKATLQLDLQNLQAALVQFEQAEHQFATDTRADVSFHGHGGVDRSDDMKGLDLGGLEDLFSFLRIE
jgi:uncharacterized protein (TIGR03118 family)